MQIERIAAWIHHDPGRSDGVVEAVVHMAMDPQIGKPEGCAKIGDEPRVARMVRETRMNRLRMHTMMGNCHSWTLVNLAERTEQPGPLALVDCECIFRYAPDDDESQDAIDAGDYEIISARREDDEDWGRIF